MNIRLPRLTTFLLVTVSAIVALAVAYSTAASGLGTANVPPMSKSDQLEVRQLLDLPTAWVPFEAKVRIFSPDMQKVEGRVYRASSGSLRVETGPVGGPIRTIDVRNIPERTHYLYMRHRGQVQASWTSAPMDVPEWGGIQPINRWSNEQGLRKHPFRVSAGLGEKPNVFASEGFEVYEYHDLGGNTHLQAPQLNMFDLVNQSITGRREELYDVVLREPPAEVFVPPPGAPVGQLSEKRGMVAVRKEAHVAHHK